MLLFVKTKVEGRGEMRELIEGASKLACKQTSKQANKQTCNMDWTVWDGWENDACYDYNNKELRLIGMNGRKE